MGHNGCCSPHGDSEKKGAELRTALSLVVVLGLVGTLAACSPAAPDCTPTKAGKVSNGIDVSGKIGDKPTVKMEAPVTTTTTQRTVVTEGDGAVALEGDTVTLEYTIFNGTTGEEIEGGGSAYESDPAELALDANLIPGFTKTLECSTEGSRVVGVLSPDDGIIPENQAQFGLTEADSLVIVADVIGRAPASTETPAAEEPEESITPEISKADGEDQPLPDGFPAIQVAIADDESGTPTVTLPGGTAPTDLQVGVLKKGDGDTLEEGASAVVNYVGMNWRDSSVFDSSWVRGEPATFDTTRLIEGFTQGLVGQTVGSQVLIVIPPALGYGPQGGNADAGIAADDTIVFLVDILAVS